MTGAVLVLNAGSSSLKFALYTGARADLAVVCEGQVEGLGTAPYMVVKDAGGKTLGEDRWPPAVAGEGHGLALERLSAWARKHLDLPEIGVVGHRVVHGGPKFAAAVRIDEQVLEAIEVYVPLAPLHQPHNLAAIREIAERRPELAQVACFDTAFHRGHASVVERFGLPDELHQAGVRRYGFHGLSYEYIAERLRVLDPEVARGRVVVAHLGNGASMCAMRDGRSVDSTMGLSALDGLPMGTRCGSLDPGVVFYLLRGGMGVDEVEALLYRESGLKGVSGVSSDMRDLLASSEPRANEAVEYFVFRIARELGALAAVLGGLDALVFTAGIGERSPEIRARVCERARWLGVTLDEVANQRNEGVISVAGTEPSVWVVPTDEERMIALDALDVLESH